MTETEVRRTIAKALQGARTMDPHCHLNPGKPVALNLTDILLYHHVWIELISAGMDQRETNLTGLPHELADPGLEPAERVRRALPFLPRIRNSTIAVMLRWLLEDVYGFREELTPAGVERLSEIVARRGREEGWQDRLFDGLCGIERCISVQRKGKVSNPRIEAAIEALGVVNLADGKRAPRAVLSELDKLLGREVRSASDFADVLKKVLHRLPIKELRFLGAWVLPDITPQLASDREVTRIIGQAREDMPLSPFELGSVTYFGMTRALELLRATPLRTIQLIVGAQVFPPHRSVTQWDGSYTEAIARLAGQFEDFHFNLATSSEVYIHDTAILAKHFPNLSVAGYWWHTFYPGLIRKSLEMRLDTVPMGKIVGFFSDAYHVEWCYPKLKLVKKVLGDVLVERVQSGWYSLDDARAIIPAILHDAARDIYHMGT
jgi:glucuronate isomerase